MRVWELLREDYNDDLRSEIITLLTAVAAEGVTEVNTQNLLTDLHNEGFSLDISGLLSILDELEVVATANEETIEIAINDADAMVGGDAEELGQDRVDTMASDKATDDIEDGL